MELTQYRELAGKRNLELGPGEYPFTGPGEWVSVDSVRNKARIWHDLEYGLPDLGTFDFILASHVFEHIRNIFGLVADCYDALSPGGALLVVTPHAFSDDAVDSPHHVRQFTERSWGYFTEALYAQRGHSGTDAHQNVPLRPWVIEQVTMVPSAEYVQLAIDAPEAFHGDVRRFRNTVREVHAIMRRPQ